MIKIILLLTIFMSCSCDQKNFPGMGDTDYKREIINGYYLSRSSSVSITLRNRAKGVNISQKVEKITLHEDFLLVEQNDLETKKRNYYIINHKKHEKKGPYSFEEFQRNLSTLNIPLEIKLKSINKTISNE